MQGRMVSHALVAFGVGCLTLAALLPTVVYSKLAVLPDNPDSTQVLKGSGFTVYFPETIRQYTNRNVTVTVKLGLDPQLKGDDDNVFWRAATAVNVDGLGLEQASIEGISLDRHTSLPSNCCGDFLITEPDDQVGKRVVHVGTTFVMPFNTQKRDYPMWDVNTQRAVTAKYLGEDEIQGLRVYHFEQVVPDADIGGQKVPGADIGFPRYASVNARMRTQVTRELWVEPNSGVPLKYTQHLNQRLRAGGKELVVFRGTISTGEPDVGSSTFAQAKQAALGLPWVRGRLSLILGPLGVAALLMALYLTARRPVRNRPRNDRAGSGRREFGSDDLPVTAAAPSPAASSARTGW